MSDLISDFLNRLQKDGYEPVGSVEEYKGGAWPRLRYEGEKKPSGRYALSIEGDWACANYGTDKDPRGFQTWKSWDNKELSNDDHAERMEWMKKAQAEIEAQTKAEQAKVGKRITKEYGAFTEPPTDHAYALLKGIKLEQARYKADTKQLVLPAVDVAAPKLVQSVQYICESGDKFFETGGRIQGTVCPLKRKDEDMTLAFLCEGYSTGMTIREATGKPVFCGWNAGNLKAAAESLKAVYPETQWIVAADNDWLASESWPKNKKWYNAGIEKSRLAAGTIGAVMIAPEFSEDDCETINRPSDWNDYACLYGLDAVKSKLLDGAKPSPLPSVSGVSMTPTIACSTDTQAAPSSNPPISHTPHKKIDATNWTTVLRWKNDNAGSGIFDKAFSLHNAKLMLEFDPLWRGTFVYDEFQQTQRVLKPLPWDKQDSFQWRDVEETDLTQLRMEMSLKNIVIGSNKEMKNVVDAAAMGRSVHPVRAYFDKLEWDLTPRLDDWAIDYLGAKEQPEEYVQAVAKCWLIAAVKRIYEPGAEFHHMLVLEGGQAAGKSSFLKQMATFQGIKYFTDNMTFDLINKPLDAANMMRGCLIIEFAEMSGKSKADREKIKQWITWTHDEFTPKFSNQITKQPRQCVFAASTNEDNYLDDPTGGRRFWPIKVGTLDHAGFEAAKEQIWAEAIHRYKSGELHYILPTDPVYNLAMCEQSQRYSESPWRVLIERYILQERVESISTGDIMRFVLNIPQERWQNKASQAAIGDVMRDLGYISKLCWDKELQKQIKKWIKP